MDIETVSEVSAHPNLLEKLSEFQRRAGSGPEKWRRSQCMMLLSWCVSGVTHVDDAGPEVDRQISFLNICFRLRVSVSLRSRLSPLLETEADRFRVHVLCRSVKHLPNWLEPGFKTPFA